MHTFYIKYQHLSPIQTRLLSGRQTLTETVKKGYHYQNTGKMVT